MTAALIFLLLVAFVWQFAKHRWYRNRYRVECVLKQAAVNSTIEAYKAQRQMHQELCALRLMNTAAIREMEKGEDWADVIE